MKPVLVVCGLGREAALAAGPATRTLAGGGDAARLANRLDTLDPTRYAAVVSFGLAGALTSDLSVGDLVLPHRCLTGVREIPVTLKRPDDGGTSRTLLGVDRPAATAQEKSDLAARFGADLVDMESHVAGAWAERQALPFGIVRVISDGSSRDLPPLVGCAMRPDGGLDGPAILRSLLSRPGQVPALVATAWDAAAAFRRLRGVGGLLGRGRGLLGGERGSLLGLDLR